MRGGCVESASPCHGGTSSVMYCPSVTLKFFCRHRLRRNVMNAPSCCRHKCSHRLLQHIARCLTQMCFDDSSSFFRDISLLFLFPQCAKDLWTNRLKISSNHGLLRREARLSGRSGNGCLVGSREGQPECEDRPENIKHFHLELTRMFHWTNVAPFAPCGTKLSGLLVGHSRPSPKEIGRSCF